MSRLTSIIGHEAMKPSLSGLVDRSGPFLFSGVPSSGKKTIAVKLSRYILCSSSKEDNCTCSSCAIFKSGHPDLKCLGFDGKILVEDIEELTAFVSLAPLLSETRVIVLDGVEKVNQEVSNRLLKVLEESGYKFFLITSDENSVSPTVASRCIRVRFGHLTQEDITNVFLTRFGLDVSKARILGWVGSGCSADVFSSAEIYLECRDRAIEFAATLSGKSSTAILEYVSNVEKKKLSAFIDMVVLVLSDILLIKGSIDDIVNSDKRSELREISKLFEFKTLLLSLNLLTQVKKYSSLNIDLGLALKSTLLRIWQVINSG